jgi:hypothetical protein
MAGGAGGPDLGLWIMLSQILPALGQCLGVGEDDPDRLLTPPHQAVSDRDVHLPHNHNIEAKEQIHDYSYCSLQAIFYRNYACLKPTGLHSFQHSCKVIEIDECCLWLAF